MSEQRDGFAEYHGADWTVRTLKAYIEAILEEQRRAINTADAEREKSAQIVREALSQQISAADAALAQHIGEQIRQVRQVIELNGRAVDAAFAASEKAILKAETAAERRFESVNEFRAQLADQTQTFMPREVAEAKIGDLAKKIDDLGKRANIDAGRASGVTASVGMMVAAAGILISLVVVAANLLTGGG